MKQGPNLALTHRKRITVLSLQAGESVTAPQKQNGSLESMMALVAAMQQKKAAAIRNIQHLTNTKTQLKERSLVTCTLGRNYS
jgi:hypothetical protein